MKIKKNVASILLISLIFMTLIMGVIAYFSGAVNNNASIAKMNYLNSKVTQTAKIATAQIDNIINQSILNDNLLNTFIVENNAVICKYSAMTSTCDINNKAPADMTFLNYKIQNSLSTLKLFDESKDHLSLSQREYMVNPNNNKFNEVSYFLDTSIIFNRQNSFMKKSLTKISNFTATCPDGTRPLDKNELTLINSNNANAATINVNGMLFPNLYCACIYGTIDIQDGQCKCEAGTFLNAKNTCEDCSPGTFSNKGAIGSCTTCPNNTYASTTKSLTCLPNTATNCIRKSKTNNICEFCDVFHGFALITTDMRNAMMHNTIAHSINAPIDTVLGNTTQCISCANFGLIYNMITILDKFWFYTITNSNYCQYAPMNTMPNCDEYMIYSPTGNLACKICDHSQLLAQDRYYSSSVDYNCYKCPIGRISMDRCQCPDGVNVSKDGVLMFNHGYRFLDRRLPTDQNYWDFNCSGSTDYTPIYNNN